MNAASPLTGSVSFQLAKLGQLATARFTDALAPFGLRPRHCAVLGVLADTAGSQLELAATIGVTPSVVVDMLDELQKLGAVSRLRDPADRRRQIAKLTEHGKELLRQATDAAYAVDAELLAGHDSAEEAELRAAVRRLSRAARPDSAPEPA